MIGRTIHEFQVEKKLAEGGMGAVYLARHRLMPSTLKVIKVLLPEHAQHPILRQRFHREAEAASQLDHENILGIDNFGMLEDGQLFIMVPYLDGQPLDAYLRSRGGRLSPHRALHLVVQLCSALDYAHARGVIHRDLKPGNVYLVPTSSNPYMLKLLDFGIAKVVGARARDDGPKTQRGIAMGTPGYMAIEQYERADDVTHLADVYSLAATIWCIVSGQPPWQHQEPSVLYFLQRTQAPARPPIEVLPAAWADILLAALSVEQHVRPQSARALAMALASALPAIGNLPSGAEILAGLAPHFLRQAAPGDETVRNASGVDRIGPLLWPPRETALEPTREVLPTTLSAATGVTSALGERRDEVRGALRSSRWRLGMIAAGTLLVTALVTGQIAARVASSPGIELLGSVEPPSRDVAVAIDGSAVRSVPVVPDAAVPDAAVPDAAVPDAAASSAPAAPVAAPARTPAPAADAAPRARQPAPAEAGKEPTEKPPRSMRSTPEQPRRPARIDPDDVSGPED